MKNNIWAKTILSVYRYLERICDSIDKMVETKAMSSFYVYSSNFAESSVINIADKLIALTERKKTLINLKVLVCDALKKCDTTNAQILIEKYIDGDKSNDIAQRHGLPQRSYFRKLGGAESDFLQQMARLGYREENLSNFLAGEKWILEVYSRYSKEEKEDIELSDNKINRLAIS